MSRKTAMMISPTLEEVELAAAKIGLPQIEAQKFFYFYESKAWKVGKVRMVSFPSALAGWKLNWIDRQRNGNGFNSRDNKPPPKPQSSWAENEINKIHRELYPEKYSQR